MAVPKAKWIHARKYRQIEGIDNLYETMNMLSKSSGSKELIRKFEKIARMLQRNVKNKVQSVVHMRTGNLYRSIVGKSFKKERYIKTKGLRVVRDPAAFVAIDFRYGSHAHNIEFGHLVVKNGKVVGHAPAKPFFRPTIVSLRGQVKAAIAKAIKEEVAKITRGVRK